jgi:hypothetical protein
MGFMVETRGELGLYIHRVRALTYYNKSFVENVVLHWVERYPAKLVISPDVPIESIVKKERSVMNRFLMTTAVALLIGMAPAIAAEESNLPADNAAEAGKLPTQPGVTPDVAKQATEPSSGTADKSGAAMERSSAPPNSGAASADDDASKAAQSSDTSGGAKEQSSAPEGSSAADQSKPNPTIGSESSSKDQESSKE